MIISHCDLWNHPYSQERSSHCGAGLAVAGCNGVFQHDDRWCSLRRLWPCCSGCSGPVLANHVFAIIRSLQCNQCHPNGFQSLCYSMYDYDFVAINIFDFEFESLSLLRRAPGPLFTKRMYVLPTRSRALSKSRDWLL